MNNLHNQLIKMAKSDLAIARKNGGMLIAQTKLGTLNVRYAAGQYEIHANDGQFIGQGKLGEMANLIALLYEVVEA